MTRRRVLEEMARSKALEGHVRGVAHKAVLLVDPDMDLKQAAHALRPEGFVLTSDE